MKSKTCQKQATSSSSAAMIPSDAATHHHRHHHNQYRNNTLASRGSNVKIKPSDVNNNDNGSTTIARTTTTKMAPTHSKNNEKYSLRQRQKKLFAVPSSAVAVTAMSTALKSTTASDKFSTTSSCGSSSPTIKHSNTSTTALINCSKEKAKSKAAPLSKYRRKTANARERTRMREINSAFENLRRCVPHTITGDESTSSNEKLTKITTLRLAMKYIRILSEALENPSFQEDFLLECQNDGDHRFSSRDWVQPVSAPLDEEVPSPATVVPQSRPKVKKAKLQTNKASTKRQRSKTKSQDNLSPYLTSSTFSSSSSSAYASMSTSPFLDDCHSMTDLSSMILESDGESLHLSEPCLSPLNRNYHLGIQCMDSLAGFIKNTPIAISMENPLELSLRLLEPDADSLEFSADQQPSTCISPLVTLESFNPFADLLHTEFPENSSIDLFLT